MVSYAVFYSACPAIGLLRSGINLERNLLEKKTSSALSAPAGFASSVQELLRQSLVMADGLSWPSSGWDGVPPPSNEYSYPR